MSKEVIYNIGVKVGVSIVLINGYYWFYMHDTKFDHGPDVVGEAISMSLVGCLIGLSGVLVSHWLFADRREKRLGRRRTALHVVAAIAIYCVLAGLWLRKNG